MRKGLLIVFSIILAAGVWAQEQKEVITGASYANDVYYNLESGIVSSAERENWDIAFAVPPIELGVSILTNGGAFVELYTYNQGDINDWATLDTTGMTWDPMYNSLVSWEMGAFNANSGVHPDYGWGTYATGGMISGDSLYVLKTVGGNYKKMAILQRNAAMGTWEIKYANLDGSEEVVDTLTTTDVTSNFIYYSVDSTEVVEREPAAGEWDLLFTKYWDNSIPYSVTGVLTNRKHVVAQEVKMEGLDQETYVDFVDSAFTDTISIIGSDWKSFNMGTFSYDLDSTVLFFLKKYSDWDSNNEVWLDSAYFKIYFTGFSGGMTDGKYTFMQERLSLVSNGKRNMIQLLELYPNPATDRIQVLFDHVGEASIQIIDMTGRTVYNSRHQAGGFTNLTLDVDRLEPGMFFLKVDTGSENGVVRFIKE
jgi:hypothetical protein